MTFAWLWCKIAGHTRPSYSGDGKFYCTICGKLLPDKI
jgi:hypothetical protein